MARNSVAVKEPFAPVVLNQAGVPFADALWYSRLPPRAKVQALRAPRGQSILQRVREFMMRDSTDTAVQMSAV